MREAQAVMADLAASGLSPEQLALVMELSATVAAEARPAIDKAAKNKRLYDREYRREERRKNRTTSHDSDDIADKGSLEVSPPAPPLPKPSKSAPLSPPKKGKVEVPDWMPADEWEAFKEMRRKMRSVPFTETAERGIIADLEKGRAEGHCPAKMLLKAVKSGHRAIFPDETTRGAKNGKIELTAQQWRERAEMHIRFGNPDRADECRRKAVQLEQRLSN